MMPIAGGRLAVRLAIHLVQFRQSFQDLSISLSEAGRMGNVHPTFLNEDAAERAEWKVGFRPVSLSAVSKTLRRSGALAFPEILLAGSFPIQR